MNGQYIEENGVPKPCTDLMEWGQFMEKADRRVAYTETPNGKVSTVFLGLDHAFGTSPPILYETMVFGGPMNHDMDRYSSRDDALRGHEIMVNRVNALSKNDS